MAGKTITKREVCERIAGSNGLSQAVVKAVVNQFLDEIITDLGKGNRIEFRDFGVFRVRLQPPTKARNPRTNEAVHVPAKAVACFKAGRKMVEEAQKAMPHLRQP